MRAILGSIALVGLVTAQPVLAGPSNEGAAIAIPYGDLNISNAAGMATLMGRVRAHANRACAQVGQPAIDKAINFERCQSDFYRSAERQMRHMHQSPVSASGVAIAAR